MSESSATKLARGPALLLFLLGDFLFLALAGWIVQQAKTPVSLWEIAALIICVGAGAWLSILPFLWDYKAGLRLAESEKLNTTVAQIQNLELVAGQINAATAQWQSALDQSAKTVNAANEIAERMTAEAKSFTEFMQKANDTEKAHLRLEVEKLRRSEGEWLQICVRMLDHVFALHQAGLRSGQANVIQQLTSFQSACRDVVRRVGLVAFVAAPNEPFDASRHQVLDQNAPMPPDALVAETLAPGFTYQGQMLRSALVAVQSKPLAEEATLPAPPSSSPATEQQLLQPGASDLNLSL